MPTANQKEIIALKAANDALRDKLNDALRQLDVNDHMTRGLMESLEVSTQFNVAMLLKLGGSTMLDDEDQKAVVGQTLHREEVDGFVRLSVVSQAVGEAAAQAAVHDTQQH